MHVNLRPVSINIDIAHFKYASSNGAAKADMATATLGFSFPLAKPDPRYLATQPALPIPLRAPGATSATKSNGVAPTSSGSTPPGPSGEGAAGNAASSVSAAPVPPVAPSSSSAAPAAKPQSAPKKR
jgi:hypothetical protein